MSVSLWPPGLQHARLPCPSRTLGAVSNSCHQVGDAIQPSHPLSSPSPLAFNLSQHQGLFQWASSLIPKMSMFTLAISCWTTSNLPWFMDLTFQVPMQYCSLQLWTLLPSPATSTTGHFHFGSISSFFLELFLHSLTVAYWAPTNLGSSSFSVISFCLFILFMELSEQRILKWFAIVFSSGPCFVGILHHDPSILGGPTWHDS